MRNPESWIWLGVIMFCVVWIAGRVADLVADHRERKRIEKIMRGIKQ